MSSTRIRSQTREVRCVGDMVGNGAGEPVPSEGAATGAAVTGAVNIGAAVTGIWVAGAGVGAGEVGGGATVGRGPGRHAPPLGQSGPRSSWWSAGHPASQFPAGCRNVDELHRSQSPAATLHARQPATPSWHAGVGDGVGAGVGDGVGTGVGDGVGAEVVGTGSGSDGDGVCGSWHSPPNPPPPAPGTASRPSPQSAAQARLGCMYALFWHTDRLDGRAYIEVRTRQEILTLLEKMELET